MKPTPETKSFYRDARQCSEYAQDFLSRGLYRLAAREASEARALWLKVEWEKQDEPR